ncbi:hypothetical protein FRB90_000728 [Tulasnella sp. 427]|nr:hypothetical protein FRB90_000728 [Tulasnella sp. 427]
MEEEEDYYFCTNRPLGLSEFMTSDDRMGDFHSIFGPGPFDEDTAVDPVGSVPWEEMPQFIRRHNRELVKREKEQEKTVAKDVAVRKLERQERSTVTDARFHKGEWKLLDDIPPLIELVQRAGREEEKRISVKVDGSVELVGIGFFKHLPEADQERIVKERAELAMWLKGELEEKPEFLLKELEAYEKRLTENGMCNRAEEVVEAGSSTTNPDLSAIVASRTGLQLDLPIGTQEDTLAPALEEEQGQYLQTLTFSFAAN